MSLPRVRFYVAEILSAICYLHENKMIYRDLKPANVLLNGDGHIMLADFGSLTDMEGRFLDTHKSAAPLFARIQSGPPPNSSKLV